MRQNLIGAGNFESVEYWQVDVGRQRRSDEVANSQPPVHRAEVVDLIRCRQDVDGRQKGGLHRQCHRDVVHVTAAHQKVFGSSLMSITVSDDDTEQRGECQENTEDQVVSPVERRDIFNEWHCRAVQFGDVCNRNIEVSVSRPLLHQCQRRVIGYTDTQI